MIPTDREDLNVLAGEYVLGTLEPASVREVEAALSANPNLREAVAFWEQSLEPLATQAPAPPPPELWQRIDARLGAHTTPAGAAVRTGPWRSLGFWRSATAVSAAIAACLALYIAFQPAVEAPSFVAVLRAPQQERAAWIATGSRGRMFVHTVAANTAPNDRAFELWAIAPGATTPRSLGVIPADGRLELAAMPQGMREGGMLAISIEPKTGSPTGQPTGPVVFTGEMIRAN